MRIISVIVYLVMHTEASVTVVEHVEPYSCRYLAIDATKVRSFTFQVKTCNDAKIFFDTPACPEITTFSYQLSIGAYINTKVLLRKNSSSTDVVCVPVQASLSCYEYRPYWISFDDNIIIVGSGEVIGQQVILSYNDTEPFPKTNISIGTWSAKSDWNISLPNDTKTSSSSSSTSEETTKISSTMGETNEILTTDLIASSMYHTTRQEFHSETPTTEFSTLTQKTHVAEFSEDTVTTSEVGETSITELSFSPNTELIQKQLNSTLAALSIKETTNVMSSIIGQVSTDNTKSPSNHSPVSTIQYDNYNTLSSNNDNNIIGMSTRTITNIDAVITVTSTSKFLETARVDGKAETNIKTVLAEITTSVTALSQSCSCLPNDVDNAIYSMYYDSYGTLAIYNCLEGYRFGDGARSRSLVCIDGQWSATIADCQPLSCSISDYRNNTYSSVDKILQSQIEWNKCPDNLLFDEGLPIEDRKCTVRISSGLLHRNQSSCTESRCRPPPWVQNATADLHSAVRAVTIICLPTHWFSDGDKEKYIACNGDGSWIEIESCPEMLCELPLYSNHSIVEEISVRIKRFNWIYMYQTGSLLRYSCANGQRFSDGYFEKVVACSDGVWNDTLLSCGYNRCPPVPQVPSATADGVNAEAGTRVNYLCVLGFTYRSSLADVDATVQNGGYRMKWAYCNGWSWILSSGNCEAFQCYLPSISHGSISSTEDISDGYLAYGAELKITCDAGYIIKSQLEEYTKLNDSASIVLSCTENTDLLLGVSCKATQCKALGGLQLAYLVRGSLDDMSLGAKLTFACPLGHYFSTGIFSKTVRCSENQHWMPEISADCKPVWCPPLLTQLVNSTSLTYRTAVNVTCGEGQQFEQNIIFTDSTDPFQTNIGSPNEFSGSKESTSSMQSVCDSFGRWIPKVPDCIDTLQWRRVNLPVKEAEHAYAIAFVPAVIIIATIIIFVVADLPSIIKSIYYIKKSIRKCTIRRG